MHKNRFYFFFSHSFGLYVRTCTNCSFQSCDRSTAHRKKLHGQKELTNKTSQPISFINSIDGRKQLNTWADEKGSASHLYARRGGITCFWRKNVTHFYGFIFNINNSLIFRWNQKSSICLLKWAEVLILFANTFTLCAYAYVFSVTIVQPTIFENMTTIFSVPNHSDCISLISQTSILDYDRWRSYVLLCYGGFVVRCAIWPFE